MGGYFLDRSVSKVTQAMDYLHENFGHKGFVLIGLCSSAEDAFATAQQDDYLVGIVLLNGYAYKAGLFLINRLLKFYLPRLFMWHKLRSRFSKFFVRDNNTSVHNAAALAELDDDYRYIPPQQETGDALAYLTDEKTDVLFVYTGSEHDEYTHKGQLFAMFPQATQ